MYKNVDGLANQYPLHPLSVSCAGKYKELLYPAFCDKYINVEVIASVLFADAIAVTYHYV